jgi:hypothetical protein
VTHSSTINNGVIPEGAQRLSGIYSASAVEEIPDESAARLSGMTSILEIE